MTDITVSIVNAGSRDALLACLESLHRSLPRDVELEIVVLDNASEDGSVEAVRDRFPGVRLITRAFRAGFAANQNAIIRATSGRFVFILNPDTHSEDWGFGRLVSEMDARPRVAALGPKLVYPDGRQQPSAWRFPTPFASFLGLATLGRIGITQSTGDSPRSVDWLMGSALLLRRRALEQVGLFDESFFMYFEETDLCLRLHEGGWEVGYFPEVVVTHQKGESSAAFPTHCINEWWRGHHRYWQKHHSAAGARVAALMMGTRYAAAAGADSLRRNHPHGAWMRLHARNSWRVAGPGLRELAEQWNAKLARGA